MTEKRMRQIEKRIVRIKGMVAEIGPMRPGSLTRQYKNPKQRKGPYWQLSYTRAMKSRSEYIRTEWVDEIRKQIAAYKKFKRLIDEWVDLSIEISKLKIQLDKEKCLT